jgi:hypothetical protein|tara:strand:- start:22 stop:273 length:252 start_codon:yes stop_codon:yes gene_type:complete
MNEELQKGYIKRIHVNQHAIKSNRKHGKSDAVLTIKTTKNNIKANHIMIGDTVRLCYAPDSPLACGATVWIETTEQIHIQDDL